MIVFSASTFTLRCSRAGELCGYFLTRHSQERMTEQSGSVQGVVDLLHGPRRTPLWYEVQFGSLPEWFHWGISRKTSEDLLSLKPPGHFLVRVSESRVGYTLSYRGGDRCKHFMIELTSDGQYFILGEKQRHKTLQDLVGFHRVTPISCHGDVLTVACRQDQAQRTDPASLSFLKLESNTAPTVVTPVPKTRKRYLRDAALSTQPCEASTPRCSSASTPADSTASHLSSTFRWSPHAEINPESRETTGSEGPNAEHFESLRSFTVNNMLPEEYSAPPAFSPGFSPDF